LAQKLSDLFFEYREKAILADAKRKENDYGKGLHH